MKINTQKLGQYISEKSIDWAEGYLIKYDSGEIKEWNVQYLKGGSVTEPTIEEINAFIPKPIAYKMSGQEILSVILSAFEKFSSQGLYNVLQDDNFHLKLETLEMAKQLAESEYLWIREAISALKTVAEQDKFTILAGLDEYIGSLGAIQWKDEKELSGEVLVPKFWGLF